MKIDRRLFIALLIVTLALMPLGLGTSDSLNNGASVKIAGPDSLEGVTTMGVSQLYATGAIQTAVNNANPGDTIFLRPKKYYDNVDVNKNLKIIGSGALLTTVDGQKLGSVFTIDQGVTATLSDMTIKNGQAFVGGGVANFGTLTLKRCDLNRNSADDGGAIYNRGSLTMDTCNINDNHANVYGGAITNEYGSTMTVRNSIFTGNTAIANAGAILNWYDATATVTNSAFIGNSAGTGGAIADNSGTMNIDRCTFMGNKATGSEVEPGTWSGNWDPLKGNGGAIYAAGTDTITNSIFINNFAINSGGAIFVDPAGTLAQSRNYFVLNRPNNIKP